MKLYKKLDSWGLRPPTVQNQRFLRRPQMKKGTTTRTIKRVDYDQNGNKRITAFTETVDDGFSNPMLVIPYTPPTPAPYPWYGYAGPMTNQWGMPPVYPYLPPTLPMAYYPSPLPLPPPKPRQEAGRKNDGLSLFTRLRLERQGLEQ
jgi:hypothetical protein